MFKSNRGISEFTTLQTEIFFVTGEKKVLLGSRYQQVLFGVIRLIIKKNVEGELIEYVWYSLFKKCIKSINIVFVTTTEYFTKALTSLVHVNLLILFVCVFLKLKMYSWYMFFLLYKYKSPTRIKVRRNSGSCFTCYYVTWSKITEAVSESLQGDHHLWYLSMKDRKVRWQAVNGTYVFVKLVVEKLALHSSV